MTVNQREQAQKSRTTPEPASAEDVVKAAVPEGWASLRLGDGLVYEVQPGFACGVHNQEGEGVPHLRPMNVSQGGRISLTDLKFVPKAIVDREERWIRGGDVVFNNTNSPELVGKTAYYNCSQPRAFSNHMTRVRCRADLLDPQYCAMFLHQRWREGYFESVCNNHVSQASVSRVVLLETPILLPPLPEQKRIVAKVEDLLARVNAARERLARVPAILKRFRQSVLAAACSGRLTADWRQDHPAACSADSLLRDLLGARRALCARPNDGHPEPAIPCPSEYEDLPDGWALASMDQLAGLVTSGSRGWAKYYSDSGPRFIRAQDINTDELRLDTVAHVKPPKGAEGARTRVRQGDLLITITGANVTKSAAVRLEIGEAYVSQHVALVRPVTVDILDFLHLWTISPVHGRARLLADAYGAGKPGLNLDNIRQMPVAMPSLEEQEEISKRVRALLGLADTIERRLKFGAAREEMLTQAILTKAFRGELVPTEGYLARAGGRPYEPASALLARLRLPQIANPASEKRGKAWRMTGQATK